jgi:hypothetical protein
VTPPSTSNPDRDAPAWLEAQVYAPRRQRTLDHVRQAVESLVTANQRVSLASIAAMSKALDPEGRGISTSAIVGNAQARAYYERHRRWTPLRRRRSPSTPTASVNLVRPRISLSRDLTRARQRYLRLGKSVLVERLVALEHAHAKQEERWLRVNDELLTWKLRAALGETVAPQKFTVEGEQGSKVDEHHGAGSRCAGDRGRGEGDAAAVHPRVQAEDCPGGRWV